MLVKALQFPFPITLLTHPSVANNCPIFDQTNPLWGKKVMAPSHLLMERWGCLITALASGLHNFSISFDPGQLCDKLATAGGFTPDGGLIWHTLESLFPSVKFIGKYVTTADTVSHEQEKTIVSSLEQIKRLISYGQPVFINVDSVGNDGIVDHWVVADEVVPNDFWIMDPAWGDRILFSKRYHALETGVKGYGVVVSTPSYFPDTTTVEEKNIGVVIGKLGMAIKADVSRTTRDLMVSESLDSLVR